jgi:ribosomal protein S21
LHPKKLRNIVPGKVQSIKVVDNDLSTALKVWKKMLKENNTIEDCYENKFYNKPSRQKRLAKNTAIYLQSKEAK